MMDSEKLVEYLKQWDFKIKSKKEFSETYNVSIKTITKYLRQFEINYNNRTLSCDQNRDVNGRFCLSLRRDSNNVLCSGSEAANRVRSSASPPRNFVPSE